MDKFYSPKEVAEILNLSGETIRRKIKAGKIKGFRTGKQFRVSGEALKDYIEKGEDGGR